MSMLLSLMLAGAVQGRVLPEIDRRALELQARAEALQSRPAARPAQRPVAAVQRQPVRPAVVRTASTSNNLDLSAITTICRAAGNQPDPANFLATLSRAYSLTQAQSSSLRTSCAAYLAGRADARTSDGVPAH